MLPMDTKPVTRGNNVVLRSKPCHQTSSVPYSTENRSNFVAVFCNKQPEVIDIFHNNAIHIEDMMA